MQSTCPQPVPPPPSYWDLSSTVESILTTGSNIQGWSLDAQDQFTGGVISAFPYADESTVGARIIYRNKEYDTKFQFRWPAHISSYKELLPIVSRGFNVGDSSKYFFQMAMETGHLTHTFMHPAFFLSLTNMMYEVGPMTVTGSTRLAPNTFLSGRINYDTKRCGLQNAEIIALQRQFVPLWNADTLLRYNLRDGASLELRGPVTDTIQAGVIAAARRFIVGVQAMSPCGARMLFNTNVTDGTYTLTMIRNITDIWKIHATYTSNIFGWGKKSGPRFGLCFTDQSMEMTPEQTLL